jgi:hypothetical protein
MSNDKIGSGNTDFTFLRLLLVCLDYYFSNHDPAAATNVNHVHSRDKIEPNDGLYFQISGTRYSRRGRSHFAFCIAPYRFYLQDDAQQTCTIVLKYESSK